MYCNFSYNKYCVSRAGVTERFTALCLPHGRSWVQTLSFHQYLSTQVYGSKRLGCHVDLYTISRNNTQVTKHASDKSTPTLKPRADNTRSPKQGKVSVALRKGSMSSIYLKKTITVHLGVTLSVIRKDTLY